MLNPSRRLGVTRENFRVTDDDVTDDVAMPRQPTDRQRLNHDEAGRGWREQPTWAINASLVAHARRI